jgi:hypothetical protein
MCKTSKELTEQPISVGVNDGVPGLGLGAGTVQTEPASMGTGESTEKNVLTNRRHQFSSPGRPLFFRAIEVRDARVGLEWQGVRSAACDAIPLQSRDGELSGACPSQAIYHGF